MRNRPDWSHAWAVAVAVPRGELAAQIASSPTDRNVLIVDPAYVRTPEPTDLSARHPYAQTAGDRLRIGYGKFTVYLGAAAGCGKTYAMLDRAHQMKAQGIDVVAALVETHGRADTERMLQGIEILPRKSGELDREALLARRPEVALIDELAHTNSPGSDYPKRYEEVLSIVRAGISVITTLNVQHLEGLGYSVLRMTGQQIRETLPDGILELADDVILIDAAPEVLRERLRQGKIYPRERIDLALSNFFTIDNLTALRELAIRETMHARTSMRMPSPFAHLILGVQSRLRDVGLVQRCRRIAGRLAIEFTVVHVAESAQAKSDPVILDLAKAAKEARAAWRLEIAPKPSAALVKLASEIDGAAIIVEGARGRRRFWQPQPFARQLLDAGAKDLLVLSSVPYDNS